MLTTISRTQHQPAWPAGAPAIETAVQRAQNLVKGYEPIGLDEMAGVSLLNRTDTKFMIGASALYPQLKQNNFKARHLLVQKLIQGESHGQYH